MTGFLDTHWPDLVLFDRDGTLVRNVPYNGDPDLVDPMPGATELLTALRGRGVRTGVVTNQSGVASGLLSLDQVAAVHRRIEDLLGHFDIWQICPHGPLDGCRCRKPEPGLILDACTELRVSPSETVVIGDIGSDVRAAQAAGAHPILVPTPETRREEVEVAPVVAPDLAAVLGLLDVGVRR